MADAPAQAQDDVVFDEELSGPSHASARSAETHQRLNDMEADIQEIKTSVNDMQSVLLQILDKLGSDGNRTASTTLPMEASVILPVQPSVPSAPTVLPTVPRQSVPLQTLPSPLCVTQPPARSSLLALAGGASTHPTAGLYPEHDPNEFVTPAATQFPATQQRGMEAVADLLFGLGDHGYPVQGGEAQQPRVASPEMQVKETGPDKAWQAALVISAIKHGTDPRLMLMPQQRINNASIASPEVCSLARHDCFSRKTSSSRALKCLRFS